jgi:ribosomal protein S18 acetylase RimI-like enzyme
MSSTDLSTQTLQTSEPRIRLATQADLPLMEWEGEYTHFRRVYARAWQRAERGDALLWVADAEERLVAQLFVLLRSEYAPEAADGSKRAFIHSFRVRTELRGQGLGSRLLHTAEDDLVARGYQWAYLHVAHDNSGVIRLYERHGYDRQGYVSGEWSYEDHLGQERHVSEPGWRMAKLLT